MTASDHRFVNGGAPAPDRALVDVLRSIVAAHPE